jgi:2-polyprenyl-3-methyl-5-hydroxy-6-metoxy-1,4-benzoquinol methylase
MADMDVTSLNSKDIYSIDYFQQGEYLDYIKDRACFEKNFQKRIKSICQYRSSGRLLEIGSASGFFLNLANKHFESTGYEICEEMAAYAKNNLALNIKSVDFLQDNISPNHYDIAVMWDCIEHLAHPDHFLKKIHSGLKKGGVIALTTGDIGSFMAKVQGHKWRLIHPPTHVHYFTRQSMAIFLKNHGFEILKIQYPGFYRSFRQMFYGLFVNKKSRLWDSINTSPWAETPFYLNFFDIMLVIARKI